MTLPSAHLLGLFVVAAGVLIAIPGPNHLYLVSRSVARGRRAGVLASVGIELGTAVHVALAAAGLSYLVAASATAFAAVRYAGAAYLFYLALQALRSAEGPHAPETTGGPLRWRGEIARAATVNLLNPKVILFFVAFLPQFVEPARGAVWSQVIVLGGLLVAMGVTSNLCYVFAASAVARAARRRARGRVSRWASAGRWAQAGVYATLAVLTLTTRPARVG